MEKKVPSKKSAPAKPKGALPTMAEAVAHKAEASERLKKQFSVTMKVAAPGMSPWLKVTCQTAGYFMFVPLPIRLIQQIPDAKGGGCIVRGAHGDDVTAKENVVEILDALGGYPVGGAASVWALAR